MCSKCVDVSKGNNNSRDEAVMLLSRAPHINLIILVIDLQIICFHLHLLSICVAFINILFWIECDV